MSPPVPECRPLLPQFVPVTHRVTHQHAEAKRCSSEDHGPSFVDCAPMLGGPWLPRSGPTCYEMHRCRFGQTVPALPSPIGRRPYLCTASVAGKVPGSPHHLAGPGHVAAACLPSHIPHKPVTLPPCPFRASSNKANRDRRGPVVRPSMYSRCTHDVLGMRSGCTQRRYRPKRASRVPHERFALIAA